MKYLISVLFIFAFVYKVVCQNTDPYYSTMKSFIKLEGQRFLINNVYNLKSDKIDSLYLYHGIKDIDNYADYGFYLAIKFYSFNDKIGAVLTSFRRTSTNSEGYLNIHLDQNEIDSLLEKSKVIYKMTNYDHKKANNMFKHHMVKFNDKIYLDYVRIDFDNQQLNLWLSNGNFHVLNNWRWDQIRYGYEKFINLLGI